MGSDSILSRARQRGVGVDSVEAARMRGSVLAQIFEQEAAPVRIDRYAIQRCIGRGGMGVVFAAYDPELDREIAIKLLSRTPDEGEASRQRLLHEARALARLQHPNVVKIYDVGMHRDRPFIAMELIRGETLRAWVERQPSWRARLHAYLQAGEGLAAAHAVGLAHRDFKPDNVLMAEDGRVRVVDFGLAGLDATLPSPPNPSSPSPRVVAGTRGYMAPEVRAGELADARSDQFSFCVALKEALQDPRWLDAALRRGIAEDASSRWPSMRALLDACRRDPTRRRAASIVLAVAVGSIVVTGVASREDERAQERACEQVAARVEDGWNDTRAARVAESFAATGLSHAATSEAKLDAQLTAWRDELASSVRAGCRSYGEGDLSEQALEQRLACQVAHRERLEALTDALVPADRAVVNAAVGAAFELPDPSRCADEAGLARWLESTSSETETALRERLADAELLARLGRLDLSREETERARADAIASGDDALVAAARLRWSVSLQRDGDLEAAVDEAEAAYFAALRGNDDELALRCATRLARVLGSILGRYDDTAEWIRHANAIVPRLASGNELLVAAVVDAEGELALQRGELDAAVVAFERVVELRSAHAGPEHPLVGDALTELATALGQRDDFARTDAVLDDAERILAAAYGDDTPSLRTAARVRCVSAGRRNEIESGLKHCQRALELGEAALGPDNPLLAGEVGNLAAMRLFVGDYAGARGLIERAIAMMRTKLGPSHSDLANQLNNLGLVDRLLDDLDASEVHLREALEMRLQLLPPEHHDIAMNRSTLADTLVAKKEWAEARALFTQAAAATAVGPPAVRRTHGSALAGIGVTAAHEGELDVALDAFERAMATPYADGSDPAARCELRRDYAVASWAAGDRSRRVLELVAGAHAACLEAGEHQEDLASWLARGEPPPSLLLDDPRNAGAE